MDAIQLLKPKQSVSDKVSPIVLTALLNYEVGPAEQPTLQHGKTAICALACNSA